MTVPWKWDDSPVEVDTIRQVVAASERDFAWAGYGIWMVRRMEKEPLIGTCGLRGTATREVELLFSLDPVMWGLGLATEAARAVLDYTGSAGRVVAFTDSGNVASQWVLARLGMTPCDSDDAPTRIWWCTVLAPATAKPGPLP